MLRGCGLDPLFRASNIRNQKSGNLPQLLCIRHHKTPSLIHFTQLKERLTFKTSTWYNKINYRNPLSTLERDGSRISDTGRSGHTSHVPRRTSHLLPNKSTKVFVHESERQT